MKRIFVSFADTRYIKSLERIKAKQNYLVLMSDIYSRKKIYQRIFFRILIQRFIDEVMVIGHGNHTL